MWQNQSTATRLSFLQKFVLLQHLQMSNCKILKPYCHSMSLQVLRKIGLCQMPMEAVRQETIYTLWFVKELRLHHLSQWGSDPRHIANDLCPLGLLRRIVSRCSLKWWWWARLIWARSCRGWRWTIEVGTAKLYLWLKSKRWIERHWYPYVTESHSAGAPARFRKLDYK